MHAGATQSTAWRVPDEVGRRTRRAEGGELAVRRIRAGFEPFRGRGLAGGCDACGNRISGGLGHRWASDLHGTAQNRRGLV
jgi:hypothetical protein